MMTEMRSFALLAFLSSSLVFSLSCSSGGGGGGGGIGGTGGGTGGSGAGGGEGGTGGSGGTVEMCVNPRDCDDDEACTANLCNAQVCAYEPLPDYAVCGSDTGVSACLGGICQLIWTSCEQEGAEDGDFCQPNPTS